jgi:hypothetical protein
VHREGIASALKPALRCLPGLADGAGIGGDGFAIRIEALGDIIMALSRGISITDISVIHPLSVRILSRAAGTAGAAASYPSPWRRSDG